MIRPWTTESSEPQASYRIFSIRKDRKRSPRNGHTQEYTIIESTGWVNVIAITPDQELVMIEQWRHGTNTVELEVPGGIMDDADESPVATGVRELREETGFEGREAKLIGEVFSNPAIMNNTCYTVMVRDCEMKHSTEFDQGEDIITRLVPLTEVRKLVAEGKIKHSLVVAALYHFELLNSKD